MTALKHIILIALYFIICPLVLANKDSVVVESSGDNTPLYLAGMKTSLENNWNVSFNFSRLVYNKPKLKSFLFIERTFEISNHNGIYNFKNFFANNSFELIAINKIKKWHGNFFESQIGIKNFLFKKKHWVFDLGVCFTSSRLFSFDVFDGVGTVNRMNIKMILLKSSIGYSVFSIDKYKCSLIIRHATMYGLFIFQEKYNLSKLTDYNIRRYKRDIKTFGRSPIQIELIYNF
jgi:hypothetical protein